ncbi:transposase domain-containing protein [Streptomyces sp. SAS_270]|uniref:transposase domain-containing protein n=1 Tax=Streptomyces sp. SAS_270 TaxID=3412748 RepID=UPI00403D1F28
MAASVSELSGLGLLTWVYPPGLVDRVVAACGRVEQRKRLLPARLVVYFVLGLALFSPAPYLDVMRQLPNFSRPRRSSLLLQAIRPPQYVGHRLTDVWSRVRFRAS